jgi:uncharacterized protein (TIGR03546 family)
MTLILLNLLRKLVVALISSNTPHQIAVAYALGGVMGLTPSNVPLTVCVIAILILFNVNFSAGMLSAAIHAVVASSLHPMAHKWGVMLLIENKALTGFWTTLYNMPVFPLFNFNNTVMLGMLLFSFAMLIPNYVVMRLFVSVYRSTLHPMLSKLKVVQAVKASKFVQWGEKIWRVAR